MNVPAATGVPLDPNPEFIVELVGKVVGRTWPEYPGGVGEYLAGIGCTPVGPRPADPVESSTDGNLTMPGMKMENGSWTVFKGLFALNFFFYSGPQVLLGYEAVRQGMIDAYGIPLEETRQGNRSAVWSFGETLIELYGHITLAPVLQLGLGHRELSGVYDEVVRSIPESDPR